MSDEAAVRNLLNFLHDKEIGKFITRRGPDGRVVCASERVVKVKEMQPAYVELLQTIVNEYGALRLNIICDMDGNVDRIEAHHMIGE